MKTDFQICILSGGVGPEREVAQVTGDSMEKALSEFFVVRRIELETAEVPEVIEPKREIVFPALHGDFGEDGQLQAILQRRGIFFAGSDAHASRICIQKTETKSMVSKVGIRVVPGVLFDGEDPPEVGELIEEVGLDLVLKPDNKGSSVDLRTAESEEEIRAHLASLNPGPWLAERRIRGREISVGILQGKSLGLVELLPEKGLYDYEAKYASSTTQYRFPAELEPELEREIRDAAERAFQFCGCRDFARVDFMVSAEEGRAYFMEINTLPGLTPASLLPKSASCCGYSFSGLARELVRPALARFRSANPLNHF